MMRQYDRLVAFCADDAERKVMANMILASRPDRIDSVANLIRAALWSLGDDLGVDMPDGVFDMRRRGCAGGRVPKPKISQVDDRKVLKFPPQTRRNSDPSHPWHADSQLRAKPQKVA